MKKIALVMLTFVSYISFGQAPPENEYPSGDLYEIKAQWDEYFDSIKVFTPDSIFYHEGNEYSRFQKWFRFWEARLAGHGDFDVYHQALAEYYKDFKPPTAEAKSTNQDSWVEIETSHNDCGVGPVHFMDVYQNNPQLMLVGSNEGGLFFSSNGGNDWVNSGTDTQWERSSIQSAVFHPTNGYIWFGASRDPINSGVSGGGKVRGTSASYSGPIREIGGLYRKGGSTASWNKIANHTTFGNSTIGIGKIMFNPNQNANFDYDLFLATDQGLWRSQNPNSSSPTFANIPISIPSSVTTLNPGFTFDPNEITIYDFEILSLSGGGTRMYMTACFYGEDSQPTPNTATEWRVMQSLDDGNTWTEVLGQTSGYSSNIKHLTVEVSKADEDKVWSLIQMQSGAYDTATNGHVKVFSQTGGTWSVVIPNNVNETFGGGHAFAVDQVQAQYIALSSPLININCLSGSASLAIYDIASASYVSGIDIGAEHGDMRDFYFSPSDQNELWVCNDGGINVSYNIGVSWTDMSNGLGVANVDAISTSYEVPDHMIMSVFHVGSYLTHTPYSTVPWNPTWHHVKGGDGTRSLMYKDDPDYMYISSQQGSWNKTTTGTTATSSNDFSGDGLTSQWWSEGALNEFHKGYIYRSGMNGTSVEVVRSLDNGVTADVPISDFQNDFPTYFSNPNGPAMIRIIKANPYNSDELYVAFRTDNWFYALFRTKNANEPNPNNVVWEELPVPRTTYDGWISGIDIDEHNSNIIYLAYSARNIFPSGCSTTNDMFIVKMDYSDLSLFPAPSFCGFDCDGTYPCEDLTMNLPNTYSGKDALIYERGSDGGIYFATDFGMYYTNNKRKAAFNATNPEDPDDFNNQSGWVKIGTGLPHIGTMDVEPNYSINQIRIGLYGRGVWEHPFQCPDDYDLNFSSINHSSYFFEAENNITSVANVPSTKDVTYRAGNFIQLSPGFSSVSGSEFHGFIHACNHPGNSFKNLENSDDPNAEWNIEDATSTPIEEGLSIYPNPSNGRFNIVYPGLTEASQLFISTIQGQSIPVSSVKSGVDQLTIDLSGYPKGIYFLQLVANDNILQEKMILR